MLITLSPENGWEFLTAMSEAWAWTQARKRFYCETGGEMTIEEYLEDAKAPDKKQLAVIEDGKMVAVLTLRLFAEKCFELHVTSQAGVSPDTIRAAIMQAGKGLFGILGADSVFTSCPVYNGHEHKGSRRLAEACGMSPSGLEWEDEAADGTRVLWREYKITRDQYYGRKEASNNN